MFQYPSELPLLCGTLLPYVGVWDQSMVLQDPAKSVDRALCVVGGNIVCGGWEPCMDLLGLDDLMGAHKSGLVHSAGSL